MRKCTFIIFLSTFAMLLIYCSRDKSISLAPNSDYDPISFNLKVDFLNDPIKSLQDIISISKIRKSGYGLLLNLDNSYSKSEIDTLKRQFQKIDINAIHSFNVKEQDTLKSNVQIAMKGAKFIWLLRKNKNNLESTPLGSVISAITKDNKHSTIIVESK